MNSKKELTMKRYLITAMIILTATLGFSQDYIDAIRYSQTNYGGTARSVSMGSAFGALGADFSSASINPAGLGLYRNNEFILSPTLNINNVTSSYLNTNTKDTKYNFNFNNISYVSSFKTGVESGIVNITLGFGYNRIKNFHSNFIVSGHGAQTTLLDYYTSYANSIGDSEYFDDFHEGMAWKTYLVDADPDPEVIEGVFYNELADYSKYEIYDGDNNFLGYGYNKSGVKSHSQRSVVEQSGRIDEYLISLGMNIDYKLYVGASFGLLDLEFEENNIFTEIDDENKCAYFKDYNLASRQQHSGFGMNFKAGLIYRPFKSLRLGAAIHTPNFFSISNYQEKDLEANYDLPLGNDTDGYHNTWESKDITESYRYKLETPLKTVLSAAYLFGERGLLSVDYEIIGYSSTKFRAAAGDNWDYSGQNEILNNTFKTTGNLHIGGEFRLSENFSLRGGFELFGNPYNKTVTFGGANIDLANNKDYLRSYSAGFGYRQQKFFLDFAYRMIDSKQAYSVHEMIAGDINYGSNIAQLTGVNSQATMTVGFRF